MKPNALWRRLDLFWLIAWSIYGLMGVSIAPLHGDEVTQLYMARDYFYQFVEGDWNKVAYHADADAIMQGGATQQELRLLNGTIPKYLFGLAVHQAGYSIDDISDQWDWGLNWTHNEARGVIPADAMLNQARLTAWFAWCLSVFGLFYLARSVGNRRVAYVATLIFALSPPVLLHGRRLMMDSFMLAGIIFTVWLAILAVRHGRWWYYVGLGVVAGLALASKHTSAFALVGVFGAMGIFALIHLQKTRQFDRLIKLMGASLLVLVTFYAFNPAWWGAPIERAQEVLALRERLLDGQTATFGAYQGFDEQFRSWLWQSFGAVPMYYEVDSWFDAPQAQAQISAYDGDWRSGIAPHGIGGTILGLLVILGAWHLIRQREQATGIMLAWAFLMLVLTLFITPLEWQRYYLPMYPVVALLAGLGVHDLLARRARLAPTKS